MGDVEEGTEGESVTETTHAVTLLSSFVLRKDFKSYRRV